MLEFLTVAGFVLGWWLGQDRWSYVPWVPPFSTIADPTPPTAAEITAGTAL